MPQEGPALSTLAAPWTVRRIQSLCPACLAVIPAELVRSDGQILMHKTCPGHGQFSELISSDADFYQRLERLADYGNPPGRPGVQSNTERDVAAAEQAPCPTACGLCSEHLSGTVILNIDLTNRCNLRCPICFADADARPAVFQVSRAEAREMMERTLRVNERPPVCVQFSGGEPTLHPELIDILADAQSFGFSQIQVATNGLRLAQDAEFAAACSEAGLNVIYLQFDGVSDEVYKKTRGRPLLDVKLKAIENCFRADIRTCLSPTIVKGINDDQVGPILQFTLEHLDEITAISWQPVAFTGRIDEAERARQRFTLADLVRCLEEQTGIVTMNDWYPFSFVEPFSRIAEIIMGRPAVHMSCHAHCGAATYLLANAKTRAAVPLPQLVDVEGLMAEITQLADSMEGGSRLGNHWRMVLATRRLKGFCRRDARLAWDSAGLAHFMEDLVNFGARYPDNKARMRDTKSSDLRPILLASMHFQDVYNYELDRVRRCVVHYAAPDGRLYPFCTYNSGPNFRKHVEQQGGSNGRPGC
jgi:uncharacterized radical SAM superfamily Fe-S cluster-containing enzyme